MSNRRCTTGGLAGRCRLGLLAGLLLCAATAVPGMSHAADLVGIYRMALANDPQIKAAEAARRAAQEKNPQSRARLLPSINFSAGVTRDRQDISNSAGLFADNTYFSTTKGYQLVLNQPLFHRDYWVQLEQADAVVAQAEAQYAAAQQDLILRVSERYFDVLAAQDNVQFANAERTAIEHQLEQAKQRFEVGLIAITDVHEAQAAYDLSAAEEIDARNQLASAQEALTEVVGARQESLAALMEKTPLITPDPADIDKWSDTAMQRNFQLIASEAQFKIASDEVALRRGGHYPTLDLNASHGYSDISGGSFGGRNVEDTAVGVELVIPLYQGGGVNSAVREAAELREQSREQLEQQRRATLRQARDAYLSVIAAIKRVTALQQAVVSAQSALEANEAGLEVGTRTSVDVLLVRGNLFRAERDHARARYDYILNTLRLKQAAGILAAADLDQINAWFTDRPKP